MPQLETQQDLDSEAKWSSKLWLDSESGQTNDVKNWYLHFFDFLVSILHNAHRLISRPYLAPGHRTRIHSIWYFWPSSNLNQKKTPKLELEKT